MKKTFSAEFMANLYPISATDFFLNNPFHSEGMKLISRNNFLALNELFVRNCGVMENANVIDYACGNLMWSLGLFPNAKSITGIEISKECLSHSKLNARKANINFIPILIKDNDDISNIPNYNFDVAMAFALIELLNSVELRKVFSNIFDKLKKMAI